MAKNEKYVQILNSAITYIIFFMFLLANGEYFKYKNLEDLYHLKLDQLAIVQKEKDKTINEIYEIQKSHYVILNRNLDNEYISKLSGLEVAFKLNSELIPNYYVVQDTFRQRLGVIYMNDLDMTIIPNNMHQYYVTTHFQNILFPGDGGYFRYDLKDGWSIFNTAAFPEDGYTSKKGILDILEWVENQEGQDLYIEYQTYDIYFVDKGNS